MEKDKRERVSFRVARKPWEVITEDMRDKGYVNGNGFRWGLYLAAFAGQIVEGKINIPKVVDK